MPDARDLPTSGEQDPTELKMLLTRKDRVANPGDYARQLENSYFKDEAALLLEVAPFIESGHFEGIRDNLMAALSHNEIHFDYVPPDKMPFLEKTKREIKKGKVVETFVLPNDFKNRVIATQVSYLMRRNLEMILRRMGRITDPEYRRQMYEMDIALAQTLRLGAQRRLSLKGQEDFEDTIGRAMQIENGARKQISRIDKVRTLPPPGPPQ